MKKIFQKKSKHYSVSVSLDSKTNQLFLVDKYGQIPLGEYSKEVEEKAIKTAEFYFNSETKSKYLDEAV